MNFCIECQYQADCEKSKQSWQEACEDFKPTERKEE